MTDENLDLDLGGSLFGDLDISGVSDNPFEIAPGTYRASCVESQVKKLKEDSDQLTLVLKWKIDDPESEFHGMPVSEYFNLPPRGVQLKDLTPKQMMSLKFFKKRLREAFDLSESEMNSVNPSQLLDRDAYITIKLTVGEDKKTGESRVYMNIQTALSVRLYNEKNADTNEADKGAFGL